MRRGGPRHAQRGKRGEGGAVKTMLSEREERRGERELQTGGNNRPRTSERIALCIPGKNGALFTDRGCPLAAS